MNEFNELFVLKKSRKKPQEGDVFLIQPLRDTYYYGKVIKTNIVSTNPFLNGWNLIYLYRESVVIRDNHFYDLLDTHNLLLPPIVTNHKGWYDGYFETVGFERISSEEKNLSYGFIDKSKDKNKIRNEEGLELHSRPEHISGYGLVSYGGIGRAIHRLLNDEDHLM
ncbi:Imm26 family immunity protein [Paenibacillus sinopodophylli]|uniref:Imm26 family immunity protein n=1 Tax=Paenibacillus sinopodophylli TaxID=1837342 RepID=UPI00110CC520|nr:Imm26 family immunity protein [Paenibacillus sinopodophylli]